MAEFYDGGGDEMGGMLRPVFDGKRIRKAIKRRPCDFNHLVLRWLDQRVVTRDYSDLPAIQPDALDALTMLPPASYPHNSSTSFATKHMHTKVNKIRCPIYVCHWTPDSKRLVTGTSTGEFTLWNGINFNFETIQQAHDTAIRAMTYTRDGSWMVTADDGGVIKYWQSNLNNVKAWKAHDEPIRGLSMAPTDLMVASCSDDRFVKIWDFHTSQVVRSLEGYSNIKCVEWHPQKAVIICGSKDNTVKMWDARGGKCIKTFHAHKRAVQATRWCPDGIHFATASQDSIAKVFDIRTMSERYTLAGHKDSIMSLCWHPVHDDVIATGGYNGHILFWQVPHTRPQAVLESAHDQAVWTIDWHPLGHILASASNDQTTKFWARSRPGDDLIDRYNCASVPGGEDRYEMVQAQLQVEETRGLPVRANFRDYRPREKGTAGSTIPPATDGAASVMASTVKGGLMPAGISQTQYSAPSSDPAIALAGDADFEIPGLD